MWSKKGSQRMNWRSEQDSLQSIQGDLVARVYCRINLWRIEDREGYNIDISDHEGSNHRLYRVDLLLGKQVPTTESMLKHSNIWF